MVEKFCPELYLGEDHYAQIRNFLESIQVLFTLDIGYKNTEYFVRRQRKNSFKIDIYFFQYIVIHNFIVVHCHIH